MGLRLVTQELAILLYVTTDVGHAHRRSYVCGRHVVSPTSGVTSRLVMPIIVLGSFGARAEIFERVAFSNERRTTPPRSGRSATIY